MSIVGMRSGMIEVPALLGIRTLYVEELNNEQSARMEKWIGTVQSEGENTFERQVIDKPAGISQQQYWKDEGASSRNRTVQDHVKANSGHLDLLNPKTAGYPRGLSAELSKLKQSEFDSIIKWIKATPGGDTNKVYGTADGGPTHLAVRDASAEKKHALKEGQKWSQYFASKEYQKGLSTNLPTALADAAKG